MPYRVEQLLHNNSRLSKLIDQTAKLKKQSFIFQGMLGAEFKAHCQLAKIDAEQLVVVVDSSVWAMKFRYAIPDLLKDLKTQLEFKKITKIRYQIATSAKEVLPTKKVKINKMSLSPQNANLLRATAGQMKNADLRHGLERLADNFTGSKIIIV